MTQLFENNDFILYSTGHDYDFVGIIETKGDEPLTFFFSEELCEGCEHSTYWEDDIDERKTSLIEVYKGLKEYDGDECDKEQDIALSLYEANDFEYVNFMRTRDDKSTGFLSDPEGRGRFLAIIKAYCPEKLKEISWA